VIFEFPEHPRRRPLQLAVYRTFTPSGPRPNCTSTFDAPVPKVAQAIQMRKRRWAITWRMLILHPEGNIAIMLQ
jgi:hypothetical protein